MPKQIEVFGKSFITREALMEMTGCSPYLFRQMERKEGLKPVKFGRSVFYLLEDAKAWVDRKVAE